MIGLTRRQRNLLDFIKSYAAENNGVPPSFDEMKDALDLRSKSGIHRLITALEERGLIVRLHNRARSIEIVDNTPASTLSFIPENHRIWLEFNARGRGITPQVLAAQIIGEWISYSDRGSA